MVGANEERRVDKKTYYDWQNTYAIISRTSTYAVISGDAGPDVRWGGGGGGGGGVGNEHGYAYETTMVKPDAGFDIRGGCRNMQKNMLRTGKWNPLGACRSGCFYRPGLVLPRIRRPQVKSLPQLLDIYFNSIGRNSSLLLNFPIDKRGKIHENDIDQLMKLVDKVKADFERPYTNRGGYPVGKFKQGKRDLRFMQILDERFGAILGAEEGQSNASIYDRFFGDPVAFNKISGSGK